MTHLSKVADWWIFVRRVRDRLRRESCDSNSASAFFSVVLDTAEGGWGLGRAGVRERVAKPFGVDSWTKNGGGCAG